MILHAKSLSRHTENEPKKHNKLTNLAKAYRGSGNIVHCLHCDCLKEVNRDLDFKCGQCQNLFEAFQDRANWQQSYLQNQSWAYFTVHMARSQPRKGMDAIVKTAHTAKNFIGIKKSIRMKPLY